MGGGLHRKAFTLIELLVVIAIIGILASIVLTAVNSTRNRAKVANIQATLRNASLEAEMHYSRHLTYAGICGTSPNFNDGPLEEMMESIRSQGALVGCWVAQQPSVGNNGGNLVGIPSADANIERQVMGRQDWAITVYFNDNHYSVNPQGVVVFDTVSDQLSNQHWQPAMDYCQENNKRLPSASQLKALRMAHGDPASGSWDATATGFPAVNHWSSTEYSLSSQNNEAWRINFANGDVHMNLKETNRNVRCVS